MSQNDLELLRTISVRKLDRMILWERFANSISWAAVIFGVIALALYIGHLGAK